MKKVTKVLAIVLTFMVLASIVVPMQVKADSMYPNNVTTFAGFELTSTVDVNFNAGSIAGLIGRSPLSDFRAAAGLTDEEIEQNFHPVVYTRECSLEESITDALRAKATEIGSERVVTFIDIFLFKQTTESTLISSFPNYVEYTIKLPSSLDSSEMEYALICYYDGRMQLFKDTDADYSTLTFSTNKSAPYTIVRAWDGTFDNIENGAYIDDLAAATATDDSELDDVPKTGDSYIFVFFVLVAILASGFTIYFSRKEKEI